MSQASPILPSDLRLSGRRIGLRPLVVDDAPALLRITEAEAFQHSPHQPSAWDLAGFRAYLASLLAIPRCLFLAMEDLATGQIIGRSAFAHYDASLRSVEIGYTWIHPAHRGGAVNPEAKLLMLEHAFNAMQCIRVYFNADVRNTRSLAALEKIGAVREGVLRKTRLYPDGFIGDSVRFSVLLDEWPRVRETLTNLVSSRSLTPPSLQSPRP